MATIRTLADKLNLSTTTVSRVLNGRQSDKVSEKTRLRVLHAAEELGYRPNAAARALATGRTHTIGLLTFAVYPAHYSQTLQFLRQATWADQYNLNIFETMNEIRSPADIDQLRSWAVDALILFDSPNYLQPLLRSRSLPIVCVGSAVACDVDAVHIDTSRGATEAMQHLLSTGRQRIAYVHTGQPQPGECRYNAYLQQMHAAGRPIEIITCPTPSVALSRQAARDGIVQYVRTQGHPHAVFCFTDEVAIGAMRGLHDLGLAVPRDVLVVGGDGIDETAFHNPPITTIAMPMEQACRIAWQMLKERLAGCADPPRYVELHETLLIRESSRIDAHH